MRNIKQIHSVFWLGVSISMITISIGISFSLIRGSEFNVEALDTKLELSGITSKNKEVARELKQFSQELKKANSSPYKLQKLEVIEQEIEKTEQEIEAIEEVITEEKKAENEEQDRKDDSTEEN